MDDPNLLALRKHYTNPYGLYTRLREKDQIYFDETSQSWLVTSYEAVTALLNDARFVSGLGTAANSSSPYLSSLKRLTLFMSGEAHKYMQKYYFKVISSHSKTNASNYPEFCA